MPSKALGLTLIAPAFALLFLVLYSPALYGFYYTLFRIEYTVPTEFVGLQNYLRLLQDPGLAATVTRSVVFASFAVGLTVVLALVLATWIHRLSPGVGLLVQVVVIIPWIISAVVATLLFRWVFVNDIGIGVYLLQKLGLTNFQPLTNPTAAMALLIAVSVWKRLGYAVIVLLAGLKGIPTEYEEAARVDGASPWQTFRFITLPLLRTPLLLTVIVLTLSNLNTVETALVMTGGGPGDATRILPIDVYDRAFASYDFASATTLALSMFAANILLVLGYVRLTRWSV